MGYYDEYVIDGINRNNNNPTKYTKRGDDKWIQKRGLTLLGKCLKFRNEEIENLRLKIISIAYSIKGCLLNFTILGNGRVIFLHQKQDGWNIRITSNGPIREGNLPTMEAVRGNIMERIKWINHIVQSVMKKKSHAYIIYRQAKGSISMEHCDACQYLGVDKGDM